MASGRRQARRRNWRARKKRMMARAIPKGSQRTRRSTDQPKDTLEGQKKVHFNAPKSEAKKQYTS